MSNVVPGQQTIPELELELGYPSITDLSPAQEVFCNEIYLGGASVITSYLRGFPGSTEKSAAANAYRLLKKPKIQKRIAEIRVELQNRFRVEAADVVRAMSMALQVDRRLFVDEEGKPHAIHKLPAEAAAIVDLEVVLDKHGNRQALPVIPRRMAAADSLAKIMGMTKTEQLGSVHSAVNIYIPDNGRDQEDMARLQTLREKAQALKDAGVIA